VTSTGIEQEALESYARFVALRDEVDAGRRRWAEMADFFTEDAAYIDPAWGRIEGREPIRRFFEESMAGLTGHGWSTRENWIMADGHRVVSQWDQVLGERQDGTTCFVAGLSILYYAGSGLFCYGHDLLNMTHIVETLAAMEWRPPEGFNMPPPEPNRDISLPPAWAQLDPSRAS
jgi:hypothetical protein